MINPYIFRMYDIRGIVGEDLKPEVIEMIGKAFGTYVQDSGGKTVCIGKDVRPSSRDYHAAMIKGVLSTGCNVMDIGQVTTPIMSFSIDHLNVDGGCMITASHNPPRFNGMKLKLRERPVVDNELQKLRVIIEKKGFAAGKGKVKEEQTIDAYSKCIKSKIKLDKGLKVIIDAGNGSAGPIAPGILKDLGCEVTELYCNPDGTFPNHHPDPMQKTNLLDLINEVHKQKAQIGFAFDGDGDRLGIIDDKGGIVDPNEYVAILARDILQHGKRNIVYEVKVSLMLIDEVKKYGGEFKMCKTGYPFLIKAMKDNRAAIGGEASGHYYFDDPDIHFDDAMYAACRLLETLSRGDESLSKIRASLPEYFSTPEIRVECPDDKKFSVVEELKKDFQKEYAIIDIDGVRVPFPDGWGVVRPSNTEPSLTTRFEAKTKNRLHEIVQIFRDKLGVYPYITGLDKLQEI